MAKTVKKRLDGRKRTSAEGKKIILAGQTIASTTAENIREAFDGLLVNLKREHPKYTHFSFGSWHVKTQRGDTEDTALANITERENERDLYEKEASDQLESNFETIANWKPYIEPEIEVSNSADYTHFLNQEHQFVDTAIIELKEDLKYQYARKYGKKSKWWKPSEITFKQEYNIPVEDA